MEEKQQAPASRARYTLKPTTAPLPAAAGSGAGRAAGAPDAPGVARATGASGVPGAFARAENEDDDGYDPYSDRPAEAESQFQRDPWA